MTARATLENAELLEGQNRVLELIAQGAPLAEVLDLLLGVIQEQCPGTLCSILLLDSDGIHMRHGAARDLPETFIRAVDGEPIGPRAGSCGTAAFRCEPVIVEDIATDPLWENYRELALKHDLRASWSTPIFDAQHRVLGTFAMYFRAPGRPDVRHLRLIGISTHVAAIAITRHQRVEALRASEERLRLALSGGNVDVWEYEVETSTLRWHGGLKTILGSPSGVENVDFQSLVSAVHPEDRQIVQAAFHSSLAQGSGHDVEFRVIDPEGSLHWFVSKGLRENDSAGKAFRMRGVAFEVTKRKRAEEEIQKREALLVEAQRIARLGSYEWDVRTNTVRRSEELCRIFGLPSHEFESAFEGYLARVHPDDRSTTRRLIDQASRDGQPFDFEERILRPDGSIRILHSQGQFSFDDNQQPVKLVGVCQDITERKQVEQQLRAANAGPGSSTN